MAVLHFDAASKSYRIGVEHLATLESATELRGLAATAIGGAQISIGGTTATIHNRGGPVKAQFVEKDGALWPLDFDTLNMATSYFALERARAYAQGRGLGSELDRVKFLYYPNITIDGQSGILSDNAAWVTGLDAFVLPPFAKLQEIPLPMNQGVLSHEYGHAIFESQVYGKGGPDFESRWCAPGPGGEYLCGLGVFTIPSIEEGFADAWALGVTGDPLFIARSIPGEEARLVEPFDQARMCTTQDAFRQAVSNCSNSTDPPACWGAAQYVFGTVWSSALWRAGKEAGTTYDKVMDSLFRSYGQSTPSLKSSIADDDNGDTFGQLSTVAQALVAGAVDDPTRAALCDVLQDQLRLTITGCDPLANPECP